LASQINLKALGLNYSPNNLALPEGSLIVADNVIIRRDNVVESRRGFNEYTDILGDGSKRSKQVIAYKNRILNHLHQTLQYDTGEVDSNGKAIFDNFSGTIEEVEDGLRIKSIQSNKNLYFTTNKGIKKIAARTPADFTTASGFIKDAGAVKAVNFYANLNIVQGQQTGFLPVDSSVAYRVIWGYKDLNDNLILGAPSDSIAVYNYLSSITAMDINTLCLTLDKLKQSGATYFSVIHNISTNALSDTFNTSFSEEFYTETNASAETMRSNVVDIATYIDRFSLLADANAVANDKPLQISNLQTTGTLCTITFSAGNPTQVFRVGDRIEIQGETGVGFTGLNNSTTTPFWLITQVTATTVVFSCTVAASGPSAPSATINVYSYNYRNIVNTPQNDVTAQGSPTFASSLVNLDIPLDVPNSVWANIYSNIYYIIIQLKTDAALPSSKYISQALFNVYLDNLQSTTQANVKLQINIPSTIQNNPDYFVQVYRTRNFSAGQDSILGIDTTPDDEMNLVYEAFPTPAEYAALFLEFIDNYPEDLRNTNVPLYTNPATGEGINQANDIPPIAKDINFFKNVTFYANTKTRHRINPITLLGTSNINDGDKIIISDGTALGTTEYVFTLGSAELNAFTFDSSTTVADLQNKYFTMNSAEDENLYYFWYRLDNSGTDPLVPNRTGAVIDILTGDNLATICSKTANTINTLTYDFTSITNNTYTFTVTAANATIGAVYKDSSDNLFDVVATITGGTTLTAIGSTNPPSGPSTLTLVSGTGDATISYSVFSAITNVVISENVNEGITSNATIGDISASKLSLSITPGNGEDALNNKILLSQISSRAQAIDITARSMVSVINKNINSPVNGYYISGSTTLPGIMNLESKTLLDVPVYIMAQNLAVGASFSPDIAPLNSADQPSSKYITAITPGNPCTITTNIPHDLMTGDKIIISNTVTNADINGIHTIIRTGANTFTIPVNVTTVTSFTGAWSKLSDTVVSSNETKPNRIYYSKYLQPEAVPILNALDVGSEDQEILRIFPLRDSLFVFKQDGLFRISGEVEPFVVTLFDTSCILIAPDSVAVANNIIYAWTNKGISNITEAGVNEISRPVDTQILKLASSNYTTFSKVTWGLGYDSDNSYTVYTNSQIGDQYATVAFRFSNLTNTWTNIKRSQTCGVVNPFDDKIYSGSGTYELIDQERKQFNRLDYSDRDFGVQLTDTNILNGGSTLRIASVAGIKAGDVITQNQILTIYAYNSLLDKLEFDPSTQNNYEALTITTGANLRTAIVTLANLLDTDAGITSTSYFANIGDYTGIITDVTPGITTTTVTTSTPHGLITNRRVTISGTNGIITPSINGTYSVTVTSPTTFTIPVVIIVGDSNPLGIGLTYSTNPNLQSQEDIAACYNIMINMLNQLASGTSFKNYALVSGTQLYEAVILSVNKALNILTLNLPLQWIVGPAQVYTSISCELQYSPLIFGDPLKLKQIYEATFMFANKAFTTATASFSSDLKPEFFPIQFYGQGNGIYGHYSEPGYGFGFYGGESNSAPFRTIIPRDTQRCRYINVKYAHNVARELWSLYGVTLTGNVQESTRAYR
jgi:hypothetical protein